MRGLARWSLVLVVAVGAAPSIARAQEDEPIGAAIATGALKFELAAIGAYTTPPVHGGITPLGLGAGGGFDFVISHVVIGGGVVAYAGGADDAGSSTHALVYGGELGYDLQLGSVVSIRPLFGIGATTVTHTLPSSTTSSTTPAALPSRGGRDASPVDVVTQATSISTGSGGGSSGSSSNSTTVTALYLAPGILTTFATSSTTFIGVGTRILYFPNVSYSADTTASWLSYSLDLRLGFRL